MRERYLEVTFRHGKPFAAYFYLPRRPGDTAARTAASTEPGLLVDYAADGRPIGIEITSPSRLTLAALNATLVALGQPPAADLDLRPLRTAAA